MERPPLPPPLSPCALLNCAQPGDVEFNGRYVCAAHSGHLSRPRPAARRVNDVCAFPTCNKPGLCAHGRDWYCKRHLRCVLVLDVHVAGQVFPVWHRVTKKKKRNIRLCQVGPCEKEACLPFRDLLVCKQHALVMPEAEQFVDPDKAAQYAPERSKSENETRVEVCNFVGCTSSSDVTRRYHGVFCAEHLPVIDDLRSRIMTAKLHGNEQVQISLRYSEIVLRKFLDDGYVQYYNELVAKHFGAPAAADLSMRD